MDGIFAVTPKKEPVKSRYFFDIRVKTARFFNAYKQNTEASLHQWIIETITWLSDVYYKKHTNYKKYLKGKNFKIWAKDIPDILYRINPKTKKVEPGKAFSPVELRGYFGGLLSYICFILSVCKVNEFYLKNKDARSQLNLFINGEYVSFIEKMTNIISFEDYLNVFYNAPEKIESLFVQFEPFLAEVESKDPSSEICFRFAENIMTCVQAMQIKVKGLPSKYVDPAEL